VSQSLLDTVATIGVSQKQTGVANAQAKRTFVAKQTATALAVRTPTQHVPPPPTATPVGPSGNGDIVIENTVTFNMQFVFWAGEEYVVDLAPGETRTLSVPVGSYGWTSVIPHNGCQLNSAENLEVIAGSSVSVRVVPTEGECEATLE